MSESTYRFSTMAEAIAAMGRTDQRFVFQSPKGDEQALTFAEIERKTASVAANLMSLDISPGDRVGLIVIEPKEFVLIFLAALRVGIIPVPLYPPMTLSELDPYMDRTEAILRSSGAKLLIATDSLRHLLWGLTELVDSLTRVSSTSTLFSDAPAPNWPAIAPDDIAFLQFTSGSTAAPKGVVVTHHALIANCHAIMVQGIAVTDDDIGVSWLPLYHDMGLIGFVLAPVYRPVTVVFIPTTRFLKRPNCWLETIHRHRGSLTSAPSFAFALATSRAEPSHLSRWDLSSVKMACCGAEPIHAQTLRAFADLFGKACGLPENAIMPAFGLAEHTLAVTFSGLSSPMKTNIVDATRFERDGVVAAPLEGQRTLEHVYCGVPFDDHEVKIVDTNSIQLKEGVEGNVLVRGPSAASQYFNNPNTTKQVFDDDGWVRTGDRGYLLGGGLHITGRSKEVIIVRGRNIHPSDIEWTVSRVDGVRQGGVIAFSHLSKGAEKLVLLFESRSNEQDEICDEVRRAISATHGVIPDQICALAPGVLPKTSSGKLRRLEARNRFLTDQLLPPHRGHKTTAAKHLLKGAHARIKASLKSQREKK